MGSDGSGVTVVADSERMGAFDVGPVAGRGSTREVDADDISDVIVLETLLAWDVARFQGTSTLSFTASNAAETHKSIGQQKLVKLKVLVETEYLTL